MKKYILELIENVFLKNGIEVMIHDKESSNFGHFFIGEKMFYFQEDCFEGQIRFSSEHKPCKNLGTGLSILDPYKGIPAENITIEYLNNLPILCNQIWGGRIRQNSEQPKYYNSFEDYLKSPINRILKYKILKANN